MEVAQEEARLAARCNWGTGGGTFPEGYGGEGVEVGLATLLADYDFDRHHPMLAKYGSGGADACHLCGVLWAPAAIRYGHLELLLR